MASFSGKDFKQVVLEQGVTREHCGPRIAAAGASPGPLGPDLAIPGLHGLSEGAFGNGYIPARPNCNPLQPLVAGGQAPAQPRPSLVVGTELESVRRLPDWYYDCTTSAIVIPEILIRITANRIGQR